MPSFSDLIWIQKASTDEERTYRTKVALDREKAAEDLDQLAREYKQAGERYEDSLSNLHYDVEKARQEFERTLEEREERWANELEDREAVISDMSERFAALEHHIMLQGLSEEAREEYLLHEEETRLARAEDLAFAVAAANNRLQSAKTKRDELLAAAKSLSKEIAESDYSTRTFREAAEEMVDVFELIIINFIEVANFDWCEINEIEEYVDSREESVRNAEIDLINLREEWENRLIKKANVETLRKIYEERVRRQALIRRGAGLFMIIMLIYIFLS